MTAADDKGGLAETVVAEATDRPLRADAQRNRDRLVEVAARAFAAEGPDTSLEAIAREAGVGIGTLYRHFPSRDHLIAQVYEREVAELCAAAGRFRAELPPDRALEAWMLRAVDYLAAKRELKESLARLFRSQPDLVRAIVGQIPQALEGLVADAAAAGTIRRDIDATDVNAALMTVYNLPDTPEWRSRAARLIGIVMAGLRAAPERDGG